MTIREKIIKRAFELTEDDNIMWCIMLEKVLKMTVESTVDADIIQILKKMFDEKTAGMQYYENIASYNCVEMEKDCQDILAEFIPGIEYIRQPSSEASKQDFIKRLTNAELTGKSIKSIKELLDK
jgi:hypothetical protein